MNALASLAAFAWVLVIGSLASFPDAYSRTAFALGIVAASGVFVVAGGLMEWRRG